MLKRLVDVTLAVTALIISAPLMAIAAVAIRVSSPGPIIFRAERIGRNASRFTMYKFRTMHLEQPTRSAITAFNDGRVFAAGAVLRRTKIDELPQFWNVINGDMSIIGPRPESPGVFQCYAPGHLETLKVQPGLASPGSIYNYTHCERILDSADPTGTYIAQVLPVKVALEIVYVRQAHLAYDLRLMFRAAWVIFCRMLGRKRFHEPPELSQAAPFIYAARTLNRPEAEHQRAPRT